MKIIDTHFRPSAVAGVRLFEVRHVLDEARGHLSVIDFQEVLPFQPQRCFITYSIPSNQTRGEHAHKECAQFLLSVSGHCHVKVDDGTRQEEFLLDRPTLGLYVPPWVWASEYRHSHDSALMVFASHPYDAGDYIRSYPEFVSQAARRRAKPSLHA